MGPGLLEDGPQYVQTATLRNGRTFDASLHRCNGALILELEPAEAVSVSFAGLYPIVRSSIDRLGRAGSLELLLDAAAPGSRCQTFPGSRGTCNYMSRVRLVADVDYTSARLAPPAGPGSAEPVDLSFAALCSVSPVHLECMRNMGVGALISIIVEGELWGLVSCHQCRSRRCIAGGDRLPIHAEAR